MLIQREKFCGNCKEYGLCAKSSKITLSTPSCSRHIFISEQDELNRKKRSAIAKRCYANLTLEQKIKRNKKLSDNQKRVRKEESQEQKDRRIKKAVNKWYSKSDEERSNIKEKLSKAQKIARSKQSPEQKMLSILNLV